MPLVGRDAETRAVADLVDGAGGDAAALLLDGEPGIGKTTLWLNGLQQARGQGIRVLSARGSAAESVLAYAGLADLMADVDDDLWADLPRPQRHGMAAALLSDVDTGTAVVDQRAVGAALLTVLTRLATRSPVLVAIDDLQWLDGSSAAAITYAARRLTNGVAWLATVRTDSASASAGWFQLARPDAIRRIPLGPLTMGELQEVLTARLGSPVARSTMLRIHQLSSGNPFYATELGKEMLRRGTGATLQLPGSLAELTRARIEQALRQSDPAVPGRCRGTTPCARRPGVGDRRSTLGHPTRRGTAAAGHGYHRHTRGAGRRPRSHRSRVGTHPRCRSSGSRYRGCTTR